VHVLLLDAGLRSNAALNIAASRHGNSEPDRHRLEAGAGCDGRATGPRASGSQSPSGLDAVNVVDPQLEMVLIKVRDHCGGLSEGLAEMILKPYESGSRDRSGLGMGLSAARRKVEAGGAG
jgi:signal transduction histidine kinase